MFFQQRVGQNIQRNSDPTSPRSFRTQKPKTQMNDKRQIQTSHLTRVERSIASSVSKDIVLSVPEDEHHPLQMVRRRFLELEDDELTADWSLKEFLLKCRQKPSQYVNFQQPMDDRSKQTLMLALYECVETLSTQQESRQLDKGTVVEIKNEMNLLKQELDETLENLTRERLHNSDLQQEVARLHELISTIFLMRLGFSQWVEIVIVTFIEVFRLVPALGQVDEALNEHVKAVTSLIEQFETGVTEIEQDTQDLGHLLESLPSKAHEINFKLRQLKESMPIVSKARSFLRDYSTRDDQMFNLPKSFMSSTHQMAQ